MDDWGASKLEDTSDVTDVDVHSDCEDGFEFVETQTGMETPVILTVRCPIIANEEIEGTDTDGSICIVHLANDYTNTSPYQTVNILN